MNERNKHIEYEAEKRKLQELALTHDEYQQRIAELVKRLGI